MSRGRIINVAHRDVHPGRMREKKGNADTPHDPSFSLSLSGFLAEPLRIGKEPKILSVNGLLLKGERLVVGENTIFYLQSECETHRRADASRSLASLTTSPLVSR